MLLITEPHLLEIHTQQHRAAVSEHWSNVINIVWLQTRMMVILWIRWSILMCCYTGRGQQQLYCTTRHGKWHWGHKPVLILEILKDNETSTKKSFTSPSVIRDSLLGRNKSSQRKSSILQGDTVVIGNWRACADSSPPLVSFSQHHLFPRCRSVDWSLNASPCL